MDLQEAFDAGFDAVKDYVDGELSRMDARLAAMEKQIEAAKPKPFDSDAFEKRLTDMHKAVSTDLAKVKEAQEKALDDRIDARAAAIVSRQIGPDLAGLRAAIEAIPLAPELPDIPAMIAEVVKAHAESIPAKVEEEVNRAVAAIPRPQDGKSITAEDVSPMIAEAVSKAVSAIPAPKDGKDGVSVKSFVIDRRGHLVTTMTDGATHDLGPVVGKDGRDGIDGKDGAPGERGEKGEPGPAGRDGIDGKDGLDGKDGVAGAKGDPGERGEKGEPGLDGKDGSEGINGKDGAPGKDGRDGCDAMDAMQDKDGNLIITFSDGRTKNVGPVVGSPGRDGKDGAVGLDGKDGTDGRDGTDGLGFDDMEEELAEDGRTIIRRYRRGDHVKEFRHTSPIPLDQGVWQQGRLYAKGDGVTFGGSWWISQIDHNMDRPAEGGSWRLAVRKGKDRTDPVKID